MTANKIITIDFDGCCVIPKFPDVGANVPMAVEALQTIGRHHRLILWTCRCNIIDIYAKANETGTGSLIEKGNYLDHAIEWFKSNDIKLWGINKNPEQLYINASPKPHADLYIDDKSGWATIKGLSGTYLDWKNVLSWMQMNDFLSSALMREIKSRKYFCNNQ
jgi:hypothetical protein